MLRLCNSNMNYRFRNRVMKTALLTSKHPPRLGAVAACLFILGSIASAASVTVHVGPSGSLTFSPGTVSIQTGDTVHWVWDSSCHSVTSGTPGNPDGKFDSGVQDPPFTFGRVFTSAGSFPYFCRGSPAWWA